MITPEQATIASVLLDARILRTVVAEVDAADFGDGRLGAIFAGMLLMPSQGIGIDAISVGGSLRDWGVRGISPADLHEWIAEVPYAANGPVYAAQVRDAARRRRYAELGDQLREAAALDGDASGLLAASVRTRLDEVRSGPQVAKVPLLDTVIRNTSTAFDWVLDGLMEHGDRLVLTGSEGNGKTTLMRQMALLAAAGLHPFTFFQLDRAMRVLYVDAENTERQWVRAAQPLAERAAQVGLADPRFTVALLCTTRLDVTKARDLGRLHKAIDEHEPDMVFIGPLYKLVPRAITNDDDAAPVLAALDTIRDRGMAMVIEAHAGHAIGGTGKRDVRPRGSSALMGWPEFGMGLRSAEQGKVELVRWRGDREERNWPTLLARGSGGWPWTPTVRL